MRDSVQVDAPASISSNDFVSCWVNFDNGNFILGIGKPGHEPFYTWQDRNPIQGIKHAGLGSWDRHVCFRNIGVHPPLANGLSELHDRVSSKPTDYWQANACASAPIAPLSSMYLWHRKIVQLLELAISSRRLHAV